MVKSPITEKQEIDLEKAGLGERILASCRNELCLKLRYMDLALGSLPAVPGEVYPAGTDGGVLYYDPEGIMMLYRQGRNYVIRLYLHTIFHCILGHPFGKGGQEVELWDLACDVAVEALIDDMKLKCAHTGAGAYRKSIYARLRERLPVLTAEGIYREIARMKLPETSLRRWMDEFCVDSHEAWESGKPEEKRIPNANQNRWEDISERMQTELALFGRERAEGEGGLLEQLKAGRRSRFDYREFLRKFMTFREELQIDPDGFDYIFYNYGMSLYGNMPLIEPLETAEVHGIEELVIAIDTSMSCSGDLVQSFLEETLCILEEEGSFFKRFRIHILQCDEQVRSDVLIRSPAERDEYLSHFALKGGGGTDFRPVFEYVEEMRAKKEFRRLKGLLYFTDGYGIFPVKMPPYETAFIFIQDRFRDVDVPPWAIKLIL